ncbi:sensor histidine kinase [Coralloluteibacterium thermophilus]|uniref:histidine kinase n=1 Tax=Coralloluteibacterium thermophilum TaxID=2707049 RepID=A0ABV9NS05_9GAMM
MPRTPRPGLQRQITVGLVAYAVLLSLALFAHGLLVNERAERMVWQSLLDIEMSHLLERMAEDPDYPLARTAGLALFVQGGDPAHAPPPGLAALPPGLHDGIDLDGTERVVLVRDAGPRRYLLALDIEDFDRHERQLAIPVVVSSAIMVLLLSVAIAFGARLLAGPLRETARRIGALEPDRPGQRIELPPKASSELVVIADALNDYLDRNARFVERERAFLDSASHELRTPVAVIAGASELALAQRDVSASVRGQLERIHRTARGVEQLVALLLVLSKDPARLTATSDRFDLAELLPDIVDDHRHLCRDKDLVLALAPLPRCELVAPLAIVRAAVGNLVRNAIENSDSGEIRIALSPQGRVDIEDPGHGMSPEEVSRIYARLARGGGRDGDGDGIGLDLIARLCEHLGWQLDIASLPGRGTHVSLDLGRNRAT